MLASATGEATVLQSFLSGDLFQAFGPYDNPAGLAVARVETTPELGASRIVATLDADANGVFRVTEWTPRTHATHRLRLVSSSEGGVASPALTRVVREPACAPTGALADSVDDEFSQALRGVLHDDPTAACGDAMDRWALGADSAR